MKQQTQENDLSGFSTCATRHLSLFFFMNWVYALVNVNVLPYERDILMVLRQTLSIKKSTSA